MTEKKDELKTEDRRNLKKRGREKDASLNSIFFF